MSGHGRPVLKQQPEQGAQGARQGQQLRAASARPHARRDPGGVKATRECPAAPRASRATATARLQPGVGGNASSSSHQPTRSGRPPSTRYGRHGTGGGSGSSPTSASSTARTAATTIPTSRPSTPTLGCTAGSRGMSVGRA
ncbi:hypothetical protein E2C01_020931 [Portunus trituberculatus]|uniref:Uncharacterized protein n=1 Tax=Portunus trituberculatus TaxID=210409 RepID=A0A5B7E3D2_PORTR|nr:hypothetical protein [Portunus trituberculatus]